MPEHGQRTERPPGLPEAVKSLAEDKSCAVGRALIKKFSWRETAA